MNHELKTGFNWRAIVTDPDNIIFKENVKLRNRGPGTGINGTFYAWDEDGNRVTSSIMMQNGKVIGNGVSTHYWVPRDKHPDQAGKPESVLYWTGERFGRCRVTNAHHVPKNVWAVGGCGILPVYNPAAEGFSGAFRGPLALTRHNMIAVKDGKVWLMYAYMTAKQILAFMKKMGFEYCILLDGGHAGIITTQKWGRGSKSFISVNAIMLKEE